jgi:HEAT repeats/Putative zinc-finger
MNCNEVQAVMIDYLDRAVDVETGAAMRAHLINCEQCRKEVDQMREMLLTMADQEMRQPGQGLRENFHVMLQSELNMETADDLLRRPREGKEEKAGIKGRIGWMTAAAFILLFGGIWIGSMLGSRKVQNVPSNVPEQLGAMQKEMKEMKEAMLFSLIDNESASQRIKAVSYTEEMSNPDQKVIQVLVSTLNHDKNVNVRLAALYSLGSFADSRVVRDSLVTSLPKQTEPLIQVMLINLLAEKKDNRAIAPIRDIISNKNTLPAVKDAAQKSLRTM